MAGTQASDGTWKSPLRKLVRFFQRSRDQWKRKHHALKKDIKREQNQRRAVERSRQHWREKATRAERRVCELEAALGALKKRARGIPVSGE